MTDTARNVRVRKWYESYNKATLLLSGLGCLVPIGAAIAAFSLIIGMSFIAVGVGISAIAVFAFIMERINKNKTIECYCPQCDNMQEVLTSTRRYVCEKCGERVDITISDASERPLSERIPYARIVLDYNKARKLERDGKEEEALELYLGNMERDKKVSVGNYERAATILEKQGKTKEALDICQRALEVDYRIDLKRYVEKTFTKRVKRLKEKL